MKACAHVLLLSPPATCLDLLVWPFDVRHVLPPGPMSSILLYFYPLVDICWIVVHSGSSLGERTARLGLVQLPAGLCRRRLSPHPYPSLPPAWVSQSPRSSRSFNPVLSQRRTGALRRPTRRGGAKSKSEPWELCEQRREREISPSSLRSSGLNLHSQPDVPASVEYLNTQWIISKLRRWTMGATVDLGLAFCF